MRKHTLIILFLVLCLTMPLIMSACYISKPAYLEDIVGTYELTSFNRSNTDEKDADGNPVTHNLLEENGVVCYLVLRGDGTGYQVYKDNDTPWRALEIKITYSYDEEETDKVKELTYISGVTFGNDNAPENGKEKLGVYFKTFKKKLTFTMPAVFKNKISQSVAYTKVSKDTDFTYVTKKTGKTFTTVPFEVAGLDNVWIEDPDPFYDNDFVYHYININIAGKKADIYYALKLDDPIDEEQKGVTVNYVIPQDGTSDVVLTIGELTLYCTRNTSGGTPFVYAARDGEIRDYWNVTKGSDFNKEEKIAAAKQYYDDFRGME